MSVLSKEGLDRRHNHRIYLRQKFQLQKGVAKSVRASEELVAGLKLRAGIFKHSSSKLNLQGRVCLYSSHSFRNQLQYSIFLHIQDLEPNSTLIEKKYLEWLEALETQKKTHNLYQFSNSWEEVNLVNPGIPVYVCKKINVVNPGSTVCSYYRIILYGNPSGMKLFLVLLLTKHGKES